MPRVGKYAEVAQPLGKLTRDTKLQLVVTPLIRTYPSTPAVPVSDAIGSATGAAACAVTGGAVAGDSPPQRASAIDDVF